MHTSLLNVRIKKIKNVHTFPEQDSLVRREVALNGELQQVVTTPSVLIILFISPKPPQFPKLRSWP